jgi:hypothetical protein
MVRSSFMAGESPGTTLQGALTLRYFWQFNGRFSTQGQNLYLQFAMPI